MRVLGLILMGVGLTRTRFAIFGGKLAENACKDSTIDFGMARRKTWHQMMRRVSLFLIVLQYCRCW